MHYMGGKEKIARPLTEYLLTHKGEATNYLEPFIGGASIFTRMAPHFPTAHGNDLDPALITLWEAVRDGWQPPTTLTREEYATLRSTNNPNDPRTAYAAYGTSFGGKRWGGYATCNRGDDYPGIAARGLLKKAPGLAGANFSAADYRQLHVDADTLVYADPPYTGTTSYAGVGTWDSGAFWNQAEEWVRVGARVFVSEYEAPTGWHVVWERERKMALAKDNNRKAVVERLFAPEGQS